MLIPSSDEDSRDDGRCSRSGRGAASAVGALRCATSFGPGPALLIARDSCDAEEELLAIETRTSAARPTGSRLLRTGTAALSAVAVFSVTGAGGAAAFSPAVLPRDGCAASSSGLVFADRPFASPLRRNSRIAGAHGFLVLRASSPVRVVWPERPPVRACGCPACEGSPRRGGRSSSARR
jgi:hypothetical protein